MDKIEPQGYSGYISSLPVVGNRTPQHIQNLVIRDYAKQHKLKFRLSATEFAIEGCYLTLDGLLESREILDGIILFSLFMLPPSAKRRAQIFDAMLSARKPILAASEGFRIATAEDAARAEDFRKINHAMLSHQVDLLALRAFS